MRSRGFALLLVSFVASHGVLAFLADHPEHYGPDDVKVTGDPEFYRYWGELVVEREAAVYSEVPIEYPPGALPFVFIPQATRAEEGSYRTPFVLLMLVVDVIAFVALVVLGRRRASLAGAWYWTGAVVLIGPIAFVRLDLVPAAATVLALERLDRRAEGAAGAWLGLGILAKLYPALLLPAAAAFARDKARLLAGTAIVIVVGLLPFVAALGPLYDSVIGYHAERGIQVESTWGLVLLVAARLGESVGITYDFGAYHMVSNATGLMEAASAALVLGSLGGLAVLAWRRARASQGPDPGILLASLCAFAALGTVFSPQYMIWLAAIAAVGIAIDRRRLLLPCALLLAASALTQALYPWLYNHMLAAETMPLVLLGARNALVVAAGLLAVFGRAGGSRLEGAQEGAHPLAQ